MLKAENISFSYGHKKNIDNMSFEVATGKNLAIIGESGCGKSTLLKLIYGLHDLDQGTILYEGKSILGPKHKLIPGEDFIKYLAQDFDLMPFITVGENVGKFLSNVNKEKKATRIFELLSVVEMTEFVDTETKFLSGGQMQRVAIARTLALEPKILLLDEPFSHIDNFRKNTLRRSIFDYLKQKNITCIVATHDSTDVLSFSDQVLVIRDGTILVNDCPKRVFQVPNSKYVASLFGEVNEISETYLYENGSEHRVILIYSHQLQISKKSKLKVVVKNSFFRGSHYLIESEHDSGILFFENDKNLMKNEIIFLKIKNPSLTVENFS